MSWWSYGKTVKMRRKYESEKNEIAQHFFEDVVHRMSKKINKNTIYHRETFWTQMVLTFKNNSNIKTAKT